MLGMDTHLWMYQNGFLMLYPYHILLLTVVLS